MNVVENVSPYKIVPYSHFTSKITSILVMRFLCDLSSNMSKARTRSTIKKFPIDLMFNSLFNHKSTILLPTIDSTIHFEICIHPYSYLSFRNSSLILFFPHFPLITFTLNKPNLYNNESDHLCHCSIFIWRTLYKN